MFFLAEAKEKGWFDWFPAEAAGSVILWSIVIVLIVVGFIGTFLPVVPGTALIWAGVLVNYFAMGMESSVLSWPSVAVITVIFILTVVVDFMSGALGAKWFGSSKWGMWGALIGGIVGLFLGIVGLIVGPIVGVFVFELAFARKKVRQASNSTVGTVVGGIAGLIGRIILAFAMVIWWATDAFIL